MKPAKPDIGASVAANPALAQFDERRSELLPLIGFEDFHSLVNPNGDDHRLATLFGQLLKLPEADVWRLMALAMAETLACGTATAELAGMAMGATLNDWRPDDIFFNLLGGKDALNAMLKDIASLSVAEGNKDEPSKVKKGIIKDHMRGANGREQKADWLPPYFQFPIKSYTANGGIAVADKWQTVATSLGL